MPTQKLHAYIRLIRLDKPIGIYLLLWPTLWAVWIAAAGYPPLKIVIIFTLGVVIMRSLGCIANDLADRKFDGFVQRTRTRPLATKELSVREAIGLGLVLCVLALFLVLFLNPYAVALSLVGFLLALSYPFAKRVTYLPQFILGAAYSWGIPMAFATLQNAVPWQGWCLYVLAVLWPVSYDTMYAMVDREDDLALGLKSTAILFGTYDLFLIGVFQLLFLFAWVGFGLLQNFGGYFYGSLGIAACFMVYQQILLKNREREGCFKAFLNNNWVGLIIFVGIVGG